MLRKTHVPRIVGASALAVVAVLAVTACGSSSTAAKTTSTTTTTTTQATGGAGGGTAFAKYATCLRRNGASFTGFGRRPAGGAPPTTGGTGRNPFANLTAKQRATLQKAQTACAKLRPTGGFRGGGNSQAFAAYRNCLKLQGVTLTQGFRPGATVTAKVRAAMAACAALRPARTAPPGGATP